MVERVLVNKNLANGRNNQWTTYNFKFKNINRIYNCNEDDWELYKIKWKMFKNGVDEKDIEELEKKSKNVARRDYEDDETNFIN